MVDSDFSEGFTEEEDEARGGYYGTDDSGRFTGYDIAAATEASLPGQTLSQSEFNAAKGITATNPFPDSFFSQLFGPERVSYAGMGIDIPGIANLAYERYKNPLTSEGTLREGLSKGEQTTFGEVVSIDKPQTTGQTIARTIFGLGSPLGPIASLIGKDQLALAPNTGLNFKGSPNYDPKLDPDSPEYQGPQGILGGLASTLEELTFGGARPLTKGSQGIMDLIQGQDAERAMGGYETFDGKKM